MRTVSVNACTRGHMYIVTQFYVERRSGTLFQTRIKEESHVQQKLKNE